MILWAALLVGMHVRSNTLILAWSDDGSAALLETRSHGPEGGGALRYDLVSATSRNGYEVSRDLSPGDGSRPQQISVTDCTAQAKALQQLLRSFSGVEVEPKSCGRTERHTIVRVTKRHLDEATASLDKTVVLPKGTSQAYTSRALVLFFSDNGDGASFHSARKR